MAELTANEQEFLKYLKRKLFFKNYDIRFKVSLHDLYQERKDLSFTFAYKGYNLPSYCKSEVKEVFLTPGKQI